MFLWNRPSSNWIESNTNKHRGKSLLLGNWRFYGVATENKVSAVDVMAAATLGGKSISDSEKLLLLLQPLVTRLLSHESRHDLALTWNEKAIFAWAELPW